jgi:TfoX N-terminal domain
VDAEGLKALFEPFGSVTVKRMFGGSGIYAEGMCFAIEADGEVFLKTDALSRADFSAADSAPFTYVAKGKSRPTSGACRQLRMKTMTSCAAGRVWVWRRRAAQLRPGRSRRQGQPSA